MEQIKVNMIPNGEVKTIHCSKGDGKTRKWGFELYKEDGIIPASSISPQLFFDSYKGGTEEILPENGSEPTTSPIIADIQYPDVLRSEQEFLYRESPSTVDGSAKITKIKGNTLVWNQLVEPIRPTSTVAGITLTNNGDGSFTLNGTATGNADFRIDQAVSAENLKSYSAGTYIMLNDLPSGVWLRIMQNTTWANVANFKPDVKIVTVQNNIDNCFIFFYVLQGTTLNNVKIYPQITNITKLGSSVITDLASFKSFYNLPYYAYTAGKLLPFMGEELKITGKNQLPLTLAILKSLNNVGTWNDNVYTFRGVNFTVTTNSDGYVTEIVANGTATDGNANFQLIPTRFSFLANAIMNGCPDGGSGTKYYIRCGANVNGSIVYYNDLGLGANIPQNIENLWIGIYNGVQVSNIVFKPMVRLVSVQDSTFEPYTTDTLSLSINDHFPTGMKSAGSAYDELTESKAITRIGSVDMGTLSWNMGSVGGHNRFGVGLGGGYSIPSGFFTNLLCSKYTIVTTGGPVDNNATNMAICGYMNTSGGLYVYIRDDSYNSAEAFKNAMSGVYLFYELATPTETTINIASLVSEQAEIPLYEDDDILIGECTTQLSSKSGFIPTKIKYQDDNGIAYSQKINLHVENEL